MLEKQIVARPRRWRRALPLIAAAAGCGTAVLASSQWLAPRPPTVIVAPAASPAPVIHVEVSPPPLPVPPPPPAPPTAPEPPAAPEPPPGTTCVVDPSTIGVPVGENDPASAQLVAVRASRHGCTIAALTQDQLFVTWDGGQTFAAHAMTGRNDIAASSGRVAIIRNRRDLGVVRAGETEITWRSVPPFARRDGDIDRVVEIAAAGAWTVLVEGRLIAATDDDGRTWRYLTAPVDRASLGDLDLDGRLTLRVIEPIRTATEEEMTAGEHIPRQTRRFQTRIVGGRWHQLATLPGSVTAATSTWSYLRDIDQSWGCGSSEKVVAVRGGQPFKIAGDLRSQDFHVSLAANDDVAFLGSGQKLRRITGKRMEEVADMPGEDDIVAVDAGGAPLASGYSGLLRWSPRGGWRRLLHVPPPPPAP